MQRSLLHAEPSSTIARVQLRWAERNPATLRRGFVFLAIAGLYVLSLATLLAQPEHFRLDLGTPHDTRFLAYFDPPEQDGDTPFRWSGPRSRLMLHGTPHVPAQLTLRLFGGHANPTDQAIGVPRALILADATNTYSFARFELDPAPSWRQYHILLPAGAASDTISRVQPIRLLADPYTSAPNDGRRLGVPLDWLAVQPVTATTTDLSALWRALLLSSLPLLALLWTRRLPAQGWLRGMRAGLAGVIALYAGGVLWLAWRDPTLLAWLVPVMPWSSGLVATLLLAMPLATTAPHPARFWGGVGLLLLAQICLALHWWLLGGMLLASVGVILVAHSHIARAALAPAPTLLAAPRWLPYALLGAIMLVALGLRFYRLDALPYGLWRDEARHMLLALRMLEDPTYRPIYEPADGVHLPGLGFYPFALALNLWGIHVWTVRIVTALAGVLVLLPLAGLAWQLYRRADVALLAAAVMAISSWQITISRFSFPTIFEPLLSLSGLWLILRGWQLLVPPQAAPNPSPAPRTIWAAIALALAGGTLIGMAVQMYHIGRIAPLLLGLMLMLLMLHHRHIWAQWQAWLPFAAAALLGFTITVSPFVGYALRHPESFNDRVGDVALLSNATQRGITYLGTLDHSLGRYLGAFHWEGDSNGRHHAPLVPFFDPFTGLGMLLGLGVLVGTWRDWRSQFILLALAITLLPGVLAVDGPHGMRSFAALSYACMAAALGWSALLSQLRQIPAVPRWASPTLVGAALVLALAWNSHTYFIRMPRDQEVWASFYPIHTRIGEFVQEQPTAATGTLFVAQSLTTNAVFQYLAYHQPVATFDLRDAGQPSRFSQPPNTGDWFVLSGYTHHADAARLRAALGRQLQPVQQGRLLPDGQTPSFVVYQVAE